MKNTFLIVLLNFVIGVLNVVCASEIEVFNFKEAYNAALKNDPIIKSSKYNEIANKENIDIARARLFPQISIQGATNQLSQTTIQELPGGGELSKTFSGPSINHQLILRQSLIKPKEISAITYAENQYKVAEIKYELDLIDLWYRVANQWIELVGANQTTEVLHNALSTMRAIQDQERIRYENGDTTKDSIVETEAQYQSAYGHYLQSLQSLNSKKKNFELLTQLDSKLLSNFKLPVNPSLLLNEVERDQIWSRTLERSKEIKIAQLQVQMQEERLKMARADHLPTLDFVAAYNIAKNDATSTQGYKYKNNQIGIQYTIPIFSGGAISSAERQAASGLAASISDADALAKKLEAEFSLNWSNFWGLHARLTAGNYLIESAKEQVKANKLAHKQGVKTLAEIANAEFGLSRRLVDQINISIDFYKYYIKLNRSDSMLSFLN